MKVYVLRNHYEEDDSIQGVYATRELAEAERDGCWAQSVREYEVEGLTAESEKGDE